MDSFLHTYFFDSDSSLPCEIIDVFKEQHHTHLK
jgi:hypothetical protein